MRAVGESISLEGTAASCSPASGAALVTSGRVGRWAQASGTPQRVWPRSAGGLVLPTGLVGHSMLLWVLCMCVSRIIKWGGGRSICLPSAVALITHTGKAAVQDVVTKAKQSNRVRHGRLGKISR